MVEGLIGWFGNLLDTAKETWQGISDALAAGDLQLAAKIAWAGIKLEWLQGTQWLRQTWAEFKDAYLRMTTEMVFAAMRTWVEFKTGVVGLWTVMENLAQSIGESIGHWLSRSSDPEVARAQDAAHQKALEHIANEVWPKYRPSKPRKKPS